MRACVFPLMSLKSSGAGHDVPAFSRKWQACNISHLCEQLSLSAFAACTLHRDKAHTGSTFFFRLFLFPVVMRPSCIPMRTQQMQPETVACTVIESTPCRPRAVMCATCHVHPSGQSHPGMLGQHEPPAVTRRVAACGRASPDPTGPLFPRAIII